jgi:hypothetical protein
MLMQGSQDELAYIVFASVIEQNWKKGYIFHLLVIIPTHQRGSKRYENPPTPEI